MKTGKESVWFYDSGNSAIETVGKNEIVYSMADDYDEKIQLDFDRKKLYNYIYLPETLRPQTIPM